MESPASVEGAADFNFNLKRLRKRLEEAERAYAILRAKGYGGPWMSLDDIACLVPDKPGIHYSD